MPRIYWMNAVYYTPASSHWAGQLENMLTTYREDAKVKHKKIVLYDNRVAGSLPVHPA